MAQLTLLAAAALPLINPEAQAVAHHTVSFADYILQSNLINVLIVATGLGFVLNKLNVGSKLDEAAQKLINPLQDAQAFRNQTEASLSQLTFKFQTLDQTKASILTAAQERAELIADQAREKTAHAVAGLHLAYESKKQRESSFLQSAILHQVVDQLFDEVGSSLPPLEICHEKLVHLLVEQLKA
jgi:F0F1-type ATP synthase membrane subunit b/b'